MATLLGDRQDISVAVTDPYEAFPTNLDHDRFVSADASSPSAVTALHDATAHVWGADLVGLAAALGTMLEAPTLMAVAHGDVGGESPGEPVRFPPPVGTRHARPMTSPLSGVRLLVADGVDVWSAIRVTAERTLAMVDDGQFAAAAILAAAALLPSGPVWESADEFLNEGRRLGLRFAQAVV